MENKRTFEYKVFQVVVIILLIKMFYVFYAAMFLTSSEFLLSFVSTLFIGFLLLLFLRSFKNGFSGFWSYSSGYGSSVLLHSTVFNQIEQKYRNLAQQYVKQKEYKKAAHVYMNLLKDHHAAASVLYDGDLYLEAATLYLKYCKDEKKAALCFEKAKAYKEALHLYLKLDDHEKVGDMHVHLNEITKAKMAYHRKKDELIRIGLYLDASELYRTILKSPTDAQNTLLEGWNKNCDAKECLTMYFNKLAKKEDLATEIQTIYETKTKESKSLFLEVLKSQFGKDAVVNKKIRDLSYQIVSELVHKNPHLISELNYLNVQNTTFTNDILKYKMKRNNKKL
jgi:tetratricopeptide (TPR) repeat protein